MNKDLDDLMREWDAGEKPNFMDPEEMKKRVLEEMSNKPAVVKDKAAYVQIHKGWFAVAAMAAAILIVMNIIFLNNSGKTSDDVSQLAALSLHDLDELRKVSSEIDFLFPEGVSWICKDAGKLEIKVANNPEMELAKEKIAIRYLVLEKTDTGWQRVHMTDIISNPGESVELDGTTKGHVWSYHAGDGVFALDSQLKFKLNGDYASVNFSSGMKNGISQEVKEIKLNGSRYKIYQAILKV